VGWSGTTDFKDQWVYDEAAQTYALDEEMAKKLADANPEAFRNIVKRMLEANGRGYWQADPEVRAYVRVLVCVCVRL
jgi:magnesium chelatase subunit H